MRLGVALMLFLLAAPVASAPGIAADSALQLSREDCARVVKHRPTLDTAYQPGVDSHGNPVVSADLEGEPVIVLPAVIPGADATGAARRKSISATPNLISEGSRSTP